MACSGTGLESNALMMILRMTASVFSEPPVAFDVDLVLSSSSTCGKSTKLPQPWAGCAS